MFEQNLERVKPYYKIEVKIKTKYKTYWSDFCDLSNNYIHFQGVEIEEGLEVTTQETAVSLLKDVTKVDLYYPWASVVNIELKRFLKKQP